MIECKIKKLSQKSRHNKYFLLVHSLLRAVFFIGINKRAAAGQRGGAVEDAKNHELAEADYMSGMKYKDIAEKHGVSINTVKSWKKRYAWNREGAHKNKKGCTQNQEGTDVEKKPAAQEVMDVIENNGLTDKQRLFCVLYTRCFNATKAYQKAYDVSYETAASAAYRMMKNVGVKEEIARLKQNRLNREMFSEEDVFQMYLDILHADISDYVDVKHNMLNLNSPLVDGRIIKKVSFGKTDSIELMDKMAALRWLSDHIGIATERQKAEIALLKAKAEREGNGDAEIEDDGFIEALEASAKEDWDNE